jgi:hypothetical protein
VVEIQSPIGDENTKGRKVQEIKYGTDERSHSVSSTLSGRIGF